MVDRDILDSLDYVSMQSYSHDSYTQVIVLCFFVSGALSALHCLAFAMFIYDGTPIK